jgi:predicted nucleic acid-binding protein
MIVVADTTPLNYLVLIGEIELLPLLYQKVLIPPRVHQELLRPQTPDDVLAWATSLPSWCEVRAVRFIADTSLADVDAGEREAILLALEASATELLMDDRAGRRAAARHSLAVTRTLGVLKQAALIGAVDLRDAFHKLEQTNFRMTDRFKADFWRRNVKP